MGTGAAGLLLRSELRRRRRVYAFAGGVFAFATAALVVLVGAVDGVQAAMGEEIGDTVAGPHRLATRNPDRLSDGRILEQGTALADRAAHAVGGRAAPRLEIEGLFLHASRYEDFDAGIIVGVDPARDPGVVPVASRIAAGRFLDAENVWLDGKPYAQIVLGVDMLEALGMRVFEGHLEPENVLNVSAGRFTLDGSTVRPVVREAVVVGTFRTGFSPLDRHVVFLHVQTARELLRLGLADEANVIVVRADDDAAVRAFAAGEGLQAASSLEFRDRYLAAVFAPLRTFTAVVGAVVLLLAGGWVAHVAGAAVLSDRARIAVLGALGLPTRLILGPLAGLILAAAAAGAAVGLLLGWSLAALLDALRWRPPGYAHLQLLVTLAPAEAAVLLAAVLATALLAALAAGLALRRIPVTEALRG